MEIAQPSSNLCCMCFGGSISTKVGLFFAAAFPPGPISGNPGRVRSYGNESINLNSSIEVRSPLTFDNRSSDKTLQTSLYLTTSHGWLPSQSSTWDTGSVARSLAYSAGGSAALGRANGNLGGPESKKALVALSILTTQSYTHRQR
jgi:hypothetical protein